MSERELVQRAKSGDFTAFQELIDAHKSKIYALAHKLAGSKEDAEDVVQETLLKAIDKIDQFRGESSFGTWLYSIALNEARQLFAQSKRADLRPIEEYLPGGGQMSHGDGLKLFDWKDPHEALEERELRDIMNLAIAELPYKYREAFLLRYIEELPIKEIAALIDESEAATKSRILRARLALRDSLTKTFEDRYAKGLP